MDKTTSDAAPRVAHSAGRGRKPGGIRFLVRRVYDGEQPQDGYRVLVDRLWPRGVSRPRAALYEWARALAPQTELRRWYGHDPDKFEEFARRYREELRSIEAQQAMERLRALARDKQVILLTATRDIQHSAARVLQDVLAEAAPHCVSGRP
jgi:uncharacterized protein YeaO (DUF488 family)